MKTICFVVVLTTMVGLISVASSEPVSSSQAAIHSNKTINLNQASASQLTNVFKGIGQKRAQSIVAYRESHGAFKSIADLERVKGLGHVFISKNIDQLQRLFVL